MAKKVNIDIGTDRCPGCGGAFALIGRVHRCSGVLREVAPAAKSRGGVESKPGDVCPTRSESTGAQDRIAGVAPRPRDTEPSLKGATKKQVYANTDERREYMREYMKNRRAAKRGKQ